MEYTLEVGDIIRHKTRKSDKYRINFIVFDKDNNVVRYGLVRPSKNPRWEYRFSAETVHTEYEKYEKINKE